MIPVGKDLAINYVRRAPVAAPIAVKPARVLVHARPAKVTLPRMRRAARTTAPRTDSPPGDESDSADPPSSQPASRRAA
jgi:hypothetical protein